MCFELVLCCYKCFLCSEVAVCFPLAVRSVLCGCGILTSLFGLLPPSCRLCLIYDSLELMVQNQDLYPWCDWTGAGSLASSPLSVSVSLSHLLPLDEVSVRVRWPVSDSAVDQHPCTSTHSSSSPLLLSARGTRLQAGGGADSPSDKATRPCLTFYPFSSFILPCSLLKHTHTLTYTHFPLTLCPSVSALKTGASLRGRQGALYVELC